MLRNLNRKSSFQTKSSEIQMENLYQISQINFISIQLPLQKLSNFQFSTILPWKTNNQKQNAHHNELSNYPNFSPNHSPPQIARFKSTTRLKAHTKNDTILRIFLACNNGQSPNANGGKARLHLHNCRWKNCTLFRLNFPRSRRQISSNYKLALNRGIGERIRASFGWMWLKRPTTME